MPVFRYTSPITRHRILVTGATRGIGLATSRELALRGHEVIVHARVLASAPDVGQLATIEADLAEQEQVERVTAESVRFGVRAIVHNAGLGFDLAQRRQNSAGIERVFAVNVLAPYLTLARSTAATHVILSSTAHYRGRPDLTDVNWLRRPWDPAAAYENSKLFVTAVGLAAARLRPDRTVFLVHPGWVPTEMGGPAAPDPLELAHVTQVALLDGDVPGAVSGGYYQHLRAEVPSATARNRAFQDKLLALCAALTGVRLA